MVNAWNVGELEQQVLPPCHYSWQVYTRELSETDGLKKINLVVKYKGNNCKIINCHNANPELLILETPEGERIIYENQLDEPIDYSKFPTRAISLMFNMRSTDVGLGLSFNLSSYGLLLMMIAKQVNMVPDELIYNGGDVHLYLNHIEPIKEQLNREPYPLPTVKISDRIVNDISEYNLDDITLENYKSHPPIKMPLSN
jgi:thymidylate synthase